MLTYNEMLKIKLKIKELDFQHFFSVTVGAALQSPEQGSPVADISMSSCSRALRPETVVSAVCHLTRIERPMRSVVRVVIPFRAQRAFTVV